LLRFVTSLELSLVRTRLIAYAPSLVKLFDFRSREAELFHFVARSVVSGEIGGRRRGASHLRPRAHALGTGAYALFKCLREYFIACGGDPSCIMLEYPSFILVFGWGL